MMKQEERVRERERERREESQQVFTSMPLFEFTLCCRFAKVTNERKMFIDVIVRT